MKDLKDIKGDLEKYEKELQEITKVVQKDTSFRLHEMDGYSEAYLVETYLEPEKARLLIERINDLKSQISNYTLDYEKSLKTQKRKEREDEEWREEQIIAVSGNIAYEKRNVLTKLLMLLFGKKMQDMNEQENVEKYGNQAIEQLIAPAIEELLRQKNEQLFSIKQTYANDPKMLKQSIGETEKYFNEQLEIVKKMYTSSLEEVKKNYNHR